MGFFDKFNPFKKNDEFNLDNMQGPPMPMDNNNMGIGDHNFEPHSFEANNYGTAPDDAAHLGNDGLFTPSPSGQHGGGQPFDSRMSMPLGESLRQSKSQGMQNGMDEYSGHDAHESRNPLQKDMELISSKLDYLKASVEAINQRLVNIEHLVRQEQQNRKW